MTVRTRTEHFPLFDSLRGIAAIFVVTYHGLYQPATFAKTGHWWWRLGIHLDVAVPIFLGISGFLLYRPFAAARGRGEPLPSIRAYAWRRALRIVPGFWFALTVLALWFWANPPGFEEVRSLRGIATFYGFAQIYHADTAIMGIGQAWTLGVEVVFYVLLPLWAITQRRVQREYAGIAVLVIVSIAWKALILAHVDPSQPGSLSTLLPMPTWLDQFAIGMLVAVLSVRYPQGPRRLWPAWAVALTCWLAACWIGGPDGSPGDPVTDRIYLVRHTLYTAFVFFLLVPTVWGRPDRGVLTSRTIGFVGTVSLSLYLFHVSWIRQLAHWWPHAPVTVPDWILWYAAVLGGSIALGAVGFYLVERPAMGLRRLVPTRSPTAPETEPAPAP